MLSKSKVITLLRTFSNEEMKSFGDFVNSPYLNSNKKCVKLYKLLKKFSPDFENTKLTREYIYNNIYSDDKYEEWKIRNLLSDMNLLAEKFIIYNGFSSRFSMLDQNSNISLIMEMQNRGLYELSLQKIHSSEKEFAKIGLDRLYYQRMLDIAGLKWNYGIYKNDLNYKIKSIDDFACYFSNVLLLDLTEQIDNSRSLSTNFNFDPFSSLIYKISSHIDFEKIIPLLKESGYENAGIAEMYYNFLRLAKNPNDENAYTQAKAQYMKYFDNFSTFEKYNSLMLLENIALILKNTDEKKYLSEILQLYRFSLEKNIHIFAGVKEMDAQLFSNMVFFSCEAGEFEWAENFVEKYISVLPSEFKENIYYYATAIICFGKKEFEMALKNILYIKYDFPRFRYETKILTLKIYYELSSFEQAFSVIDNLKHLVATNKSLSEYKKKGVINFLRFYYELLKVKSLTQSGFNFDLEKEISYSNELQSKNWLLDKIKELKIKGS